MPEDLEKIKQQKPIWLNGTSLHSNSHSVYVMKVDNVKSISVL